MFHREALDELAPVSLEPVAERSLTSLVRRDVICPDRASFAEDEAFRFRHVLIRDAAYRSLPKEVRAELHERFAAWLERTAGSRLSEFEEIVGYHLEQAYRFLAELGTLDAAGLAARGADRLESAGRRALARSDHTGAVSLLERAVALLGDDPARRASLLPGLGAALVEAGRLADAEAVLADAERAVAAAGMSASAPTSSSSNSSCDCAAGSPRAPRRRRRSSRGSSRSSSARTTTPASASRFGCEPGCIGSRRTRAPRRRRGSKRRSTPAAPGPTTNGSRSWAGSPPRSAGGPLPSPRPFAAATSSAPR